MYNKLHFANDHIFKRFEYLTSRFTNEKNDVFFRIISKHLLFIKISVFYKIDNGIEKDFLDSFLGELIDKCAKKLEQALQI
ncbi:hypothetical protein BpHYR1_046744 [Brachionus plicatilis]|uniref:Uncharacterized protein n=1 Tax=Brachionus plicatilis TaxID=10195 RepID=A0A3M7PMR3_BRAPC|nr:hypothetical protein BpHYR1_046744 [Brachionus plicatilis]